MQYEIPQKNKSGQASEHTHMVHKIQTPLEEVRGESIQEVPEVQGTCFILESLSSTPRSPPGSCLATVSPSEQYQDVARASSRRRSLESVRDRCWTTPVEGEDDLRKNSQLEFARGAHFAAAQGKGEHQPSSNPDLPLQLAALEPPREKGRELEQKRKKKKKKKKKKGGEEYSPPSPQSAEGEPAELRAQCEPESAKRWPEDEVQLVQGLQTKQGAQEARLLREKIEGAPMQLEGG